jgi:carbon-monoxide dehydrogenase large subunit
MGRYAIGQGVTAVEAAKLVAGHGRFTDDNSLVGQCHAIFVRSPHAHALIRSVDADAARKMPGVMAVLTGADYAAAELGNVPGGPPPKRRDGSPGYRPPRPAITHDRVRHVGQIVAMVVADSIARAKDAAEQVVVTYEPLAAQLDPVAALAEGAERIWPDCERNEAFFVEKGNSARAEAALNNSAHVVSGRFHITRVSANTMEPRAVVAEYDPGLEHYRVLACQQRPFVWRTMMAQHIFRIPESQMTVIAGDVGGSFGMKGGLYPEVPLVAWAAKVTGRPVKWVCERSEAQIADDQARDLLVDGEIGIDGDGRIQAVRVSSVGNIGAFLSMQGFGAPAGVAASALCGTYNVPAGHGRSSAVFTHTCPMANYRGPSGVPGVLVLERLVDMAARKLGLDPIEFRRRNYISPQAMPVRLPNGLTYDCGEFEAVMDKCLQLADYAGIVRRREEAQARGMLFGVGVSSSVDPSGSPVPECAELRFNPGGTVTILAASTAGGQGHATIYTQIVSETLGIDASKISVIEGDTSTMAWGSGTGAARTATLSGTVVLMAAQKVREKGRRIAAHALEAAPEDIDFNDGVYTVAGTDRRITFDQVAKLAFQPAKLPKGMEFGLYEVANWEPETGNIPNSFQVCEMEIDPETGQSQITRYTAVIDVGVELNPELVRGQAIGGIVQAAGQALMEEVVYDEDGQVLTGSFMDYAMPRALDTCRIEIGSHPVPTKTNPLGVKGAGETTTVGALAAIINAVNDALAPRGVENFQMPATPLRVWRAIQAARISKVA